MKLIHFIAVSALFITLAPGAMAKCDTNACLKHFPAPSTVSVQAQRLIDAAPPPFWNAHPKNAAEWKALGDTFYNAVMASVPSQIKAMKVAVTPGKIAGVPVYTITPKDLPARNKDFILLHLHGGGYVLGRGESGIQEAVLMAGIGKFKIISVDYRMAPEHPYPAAIDDMMSVYKALLKKYPANHIGVFGTSTGGAMSLILALRAKRDHLPMPAALGAGTPWSDMTKTGDSYFTNEGVDNIVVSYDGWLSSAAKAYANGHDMKDPMLSPVYGDAHGFPPVMLTSGTRDLLLSDTVRMHLKLLAANVPAELIVFEGFSHSQYHISPDVPETRLHFEQLAKFFEKNFKKN